MIQSWQETLAAQAATGPQLADSVSAASILAPEAKITLPPNFFNDLGKTIRVSGHAALSCVATTPGTLKLEVYLGGSVIAYTTDLIPLSTLGATSKPLFFQFLLRSGAVGSGTSCKLVGFGQAFSAALDAGGWFDSVAPALGTGFDGTAPQTLDLRAKFSVATNPTNITLWQYLVESLN